MIQEVKIENYKAIYESPILPLQPFTVFIGNNGTGKSSVFEALRMLYLCVTSDLGTAFKEIGELEKLRNYNADTKKTEAHSYFKGSPVSITLKCIVDSHE